VGRLLEIAYTGYALVLAFLFWGVSWIIVAVVPRLSWRWAAVRRASRWMWRSTVTPLSITGTENFPRDGRCVIVSNHTSYLDSIVLAALLPMPVSFVAKAELERNKLVYFYLRRLDTEFVDRWNKNRRTEDTRRIIARAREKKTLVFFAEGGMSPQPGLRRFKLGAFSAAAESGLPIVPVIIRGTRSKLRADTYLLRPGAVSVTVASVIDTQKVLEGSPNDPLAAARRLRAVTREIILRHCGEPDIGDEGT
jgi:1-acyl-sn-glycerol-3-phosphate acyltransferase